MKLAAVIVETRSIPSLPEIISNHLKFLPENTQLIIYNGPDTEYLQNSFPEALFSSILQYTSEILDIYNYNKLLTSEQFWQPLCKWHRVLIFQSDSMLLKYGIEQFYQYDYVGAPWAWNNDYCGNGGLSLRNPKIMLEIINKHPRQDLLNEDHFVCKQMFENKIGNLAPIEVAEKFSVEAKYKLGTFGYHAIDKWLNTEQCNKIKNQYKTNIIMTIQEKYTEKCNQPSDINQLLPYLKEYADKCETVVELGVRNCVSIYALIASKAKTVYGFDIETQPEVAECIMIAKKENKKFKYYEADVLKIQIPECDMIFIDTFHSALQLQQELKLHSHKARKYLAFHDVVTYWETAEPSYQSASNNHVDGPQGLRYAIEPFLESHPEWQKVLKCDFNNGLLILERQV